MAHTETLPSLSKNQWLTIIGSSIGMLLINQLIEQALNKQMQIAMQNESSAFAFTAAALFCNGVSIIWLQSIILMALLQPKHPETSSVPFAVKMSDFSREWLRSIGEASLWMFVFVIPGLIRWVDYTLLPFVCFFDPAYQKGEEDALVRCRALAQGNRGKLWSLWIGLGLILPLILTSLFGDYESFTEYPAMATLLVIFDALVQVLAFWILWRIYLKTRPLS